MANRKESARRKELLLPFAESADATKQVKFPAFGQGNYPPT